MGIFVTLVGDLLKMKELRPRYSGWAVTPAATDRRSEADRQAVHGLSAGSNPASQTSEDCTIVTCFTEIV